MASASALGLLFNVSSDSKGVKSQEHKMPFAFSVFEKHSRWLERGLEGGERNKLRHFLCNFSHFLSQSWNSKILDHLRLS